MRRAPRIGLALRRRRAIAIAVAVFIAGAGMLLVVERGGALAWAGLMLGLALLAKAWVRPSPMDVRVAFGVATIFALTWFGTLYYVVSTWESGEVVQLMIDTPDGPHTARVWIFDSEGSSFVIYDAEPEVAEILMAGKPVRLLRAGQQSVRQVEAMPIERVPPETMNRIDGQMHEKYGHRNVATDVYYRMLGRSRDRIVLVVRLTG